MEQNQSKDSLHEVGFKQTKDEAISASAALDMSFIGYLINNFVVARAILARYDYTDDDGNVVGNACADRFNDAYITKEND